MKKQLPFSLTLIRGAIGKEFVIKHYKDGAVQTRYPDMSGIVATPRQRKCRNLFKEAVAYAKEVIADAERKTYWQKKLRKRNAVYNAAIKEFMLREKKAKEKKVLETNRLLRMSMKNLQDENALAFKKMDLVTGFQDEMAVQSTAATGKAVLPAPKKYFASHTTFDIKTGFIIFNST
ncbi:MAG: hypothetical protein ABIN36_16535 [Ferruginibacter sp.]